jgi:hypothetical protein
MGKLLELRCLKCAHMTHLDTLNTSYGQKKGWELNCQFDSQPLKVGNCLNFLMCRWKVLDKSYNFASDLILIGGLHTKLWALKIVRGSILGISKQNDIWVLVPWPSTKNTIRGKVVASPKFGPWWVLWIHGCPCSFVHQSAPIMH